MKYAYIDGDNIGLRIETSFLNNDEISLAKVNEDVKEIVTKVTQYLLNLNQEIIFSGADGIIVKGDQLNYLELLQMIRDLNKEFTFSIGVGYSLRESYIALRYAKSNNKNIAVELENGQFSIVGR